MPHLAAAPHFGIQCWPLACPSITEFAPAFHGLALVRTNTEETITISRPDLAPPHHAHDAAGRTGNGFTNVLSAEIVS